MTDRARGTIDLAVGSHVISGVGLVIFDKDGTLIELHHYWTEMVRLRARLIRAALGLDEARETGLRRVMGADDATGRLRPEGPVGLKKREIVIRTVAEYLRDEGAGDVEGACIEAFARADAASAETLATFVRPIPGATALVAALKARGCLVAVATVDVRARAALALGHMGLGGAFDLIAGGDEVTHGKPDPEIVELVLARLGADRAGAVMVGDALNDVRMGQRAGLLASIGVLTGFATAADFEPATPYVAASVADLRVLR